MKYVFCPLLSLLFFVPVFAVEFPEIEGWKTDGAIKSFNAETLWEYINGAAELFLAYDFQELHVADLASRTAKDLIVTVNIYDQGTPLNAFGVYNTERPDNADVLEIGGGGVVLAPYQALLLKDRYYVKVDAFEGEIDASVGGSLLKAVAAALPGDDGLPEELFWLPDDDKVEGSEGFAKKDFLGLTELTECVFAEYQPKRGEAYRAFFMLPASGKAPKDDWEGLSAKWKSRKHKKRAILYREIPYRGFVGVVETERGLLGVSGSKNVREMTQRLDRMLKVL